METKIIPVRQISLEKNILLDISNSLIKKNIKIYDSTNDYNSIHFALTQGIASLFTFIQNISVFLGKIISITSITWIISNYNKSLFCLILVFVFFNTLIDMYTSKLNFTKTLALIPTTRGMDYFKRLLYLKQYASEIRIFDIYKPLKQLYISFSQKKSKLVKKYAKFELLLASIQLILQIIMQFTILIILAYQYILKKLKLSDFLVLYNSTTELSEYICALVNLLPDFYQNALYINELRKFMNCDDIINIEINNISALKFDDISFTYDNNNQVIDHFSYTFIKGNSYLIKGHNGIGKTTLLKIICGLYSPNNGKIYINNVQCSNSEVLKSNSSVLFQDYQFYAISIAENVLMRNFDPDDTKLVINALSEVGMWSKIKKLPNSIFTSFTQELDDNGTTFSGGELQRLAIARILVNKKDIIIFDEPTSALDMASKKIISKLIHSLKKESIFICISHDPYIEKDFDYIIQL